LIELSPRSQDLLKRGIRHARGREICAFVLEGEESHQEIFRVENCGISDGDFHVPEHELQRMLEFARQRTLRVIAFLHSHRSGSEMSSADMESQRSGKTPWIVVRLRDDTLEYRTYACDEGTYRHGNAATRAARPR